MWGVPIVLLSIATACVGAMGDDQPVMTAAELGALPHPAADHRLRYGNEPSQFGELRLPPTLGPHPVVIVIHGGCWLAEYGLDYMSAFSDALAAAGAATWSIEYRRVGDQGGGWPGTFVDVGRAADHLREIAPQYDLDLDRVAAVGHSAGGHLALWLAGRAGLERDDPLRGSLPIRLSGVVTQAGIPDLASYTSPDGCGSAVPGLLGGDPPFPLQLLRRSSPVEMLPLGVDTTLVIGDRDTIVPSSQARSFADAARRMGETVVVTEIAGAGHFELVDPSHPGFRVIREAIFGILAR